MWQKCSIFTPLVCCSVQWLLIAYFSICDPLMALNVVTAVNVWNVFEYCRWVVPLFQLAMRVRDREHAISIPPMAMGNRVQHVLFIAAYNEDIRVLDMVLTSV